MIRQPHHRHLVKHRRASLSGQDSATHLHLKDKGHPFEDNIDILGVKEAIHIKTERSSLNRVVTPIISHYLTSLLRCLNLQNLPYRTPTTRMMAEPGNESLMSHSWRCEHNHYTIHTIIPILSLVYVVRAKATGPVR